MKITYTDAEGQQRTIEAAAAPLKVTLDDGRTLELTPATLASLAPVAYRVVTVESSAAEASKAPPRKSAFERSQEERSAAVRVSIGTSEATPPPSPPVALRPLDPDA